MLMETVHGVIYTVDLPIGTIRLVAAYSEMGSLGTNGIRADELCNLRYGMHKGLCLHCLEIQALPPKMVVVLTTMVVLKGSHIL